MPSLREWLHEKTRAVIFPTMAACFGFEPAELHYLDLFLVKYDGEVALESCA